jgi:hypothetical protein
MLLTVTAIAVIALADPPARKEPPTQKELAAITERGRDLAGYDVAAWHASDAIQAKNPKDGTIVRYRILYCTRPLGILTRSSTIRCTAFGAPASS